MGEEDDHGGVAEREQFLFVGGELYRGFWLPLPAELGGGGHLRGTGRRRDAGLQRVRERDVQCGPEQCRGTHHGVGLGETAIEITMETRGPDHIAEIISALGAAGYAQERVL